jgi:acyl carrier protein
MNHSITEDFRKFVVENFLLGTSEDGLDEDTSFLANGIIDSTGILELIAYTEQTYALRMEDEDLTPDNLDSLRKLTLFVERKRRQVAEEVGA